MGCANSSRVSKASAISKPYDFKSVLTAGSAEALKSLIAGLDVNAAESVSGELPLSLAAQLEASPDSFTVLLDAGADPARATSSDNRPLFSVLAVWADKDKSGVVAQLLLQRGLDANKGTEAPLLTALRAFNRPLAEVLVTNAAKLDATDSHGNTPLHIAGATADAAAVAFLIGKGASVTVKNSAGVSPVMCARLGGIAPKMRLSPDWKWCQLEVLSKRDVDATDGKELETGEGVWRCPSGRCFSAYSMICPSYPRNHEVAAAIALSAGDAYSLTDAIEGAWLDGEAPPEKPANEVHADIMQAIHTLVQVLQKELQKGLASKDAIRVEAGLEMLRYANVAKLPEEERAVKMLVRMKLEQALAGRQELELKQALMSASQYGQEDSALFKSAQEMLTQILEEQQIEMLIVQLKEAMGRNDCNSVHAVLQFSKSGKLKTGTLTDRPEYTQAEVFLEQTVRNELVQATAKASQRLVEVACARARTYNLTTMKEYLALVELKRAQATKALHDAAIAKKPSEDALQKALRVALEDQDLALAGMRSEPALTEALQAYRGVLSLPLALDEEQLVKMVTQGRADVVRKHLKNEVLERAFQDLFDITHSKVRTKDRRIGELPSRLVVKEVVVVQNADALIKYVRAREGIRKQLGGTVGAGNMISLGNLKSPDVCKTFRRLPDGRQFHNVWQEADDLTRDVIDPGIHEFYLFHGTSPAAAVAITEGKFNLDLAGTNAGTLYGRGVYFAESATKSDEYTKQDERNLYPMLICRVTLGRILYTDEEYPATSRLIKQCTSGQHHSVLGDREKCRGTFREMIVYDADQAYPEFVVWYSREY